jgi:membrane-bound ClpP family serine protease
MSFLFVLLLILIGICLIILEILVIPGAIAGIFGVCLVVGGIYMSYSSFGSTYGNITLLGTLLLTIGSLVFVFKSRTWKNAMLHTESDGKMDMPDVKFHPGDTGITISRLAPMGKILVNNEEMEAKSEALFIDQATEIEVVKVLGNMLIVKPKK